MVRYFIHKDHGLFGPNSSYIIIDESEGVGYWSDIQCATRVLYELALEEGGDYIEVTKDELDKLIIMKRLNDGS